ncbi:MAG TPA: hypothetical protein VEP68_05050 [Anaeromyxobacteraceae bacterium]|nr:hypothetical protein [Anaeromyxobacteraceae bacterium]
MRWYAAGAEAPPGRYLQPRSLQLRRVSGDGGTIGGGSAGRWLRLPPSAWPFVVVAVALAGLLYVAALPLVGLFLIVRALVKETIAAFRGEAGEHRQAMRRR